MSINVATNNKISFFFMAEFIHSSISRHLGCFHILSGINAAMNIGVHIYFELVFLFSLDKYPELELLDLPPQARTTKAYVNK